MSVKVEIPVLRTSEGITLPSKPILEQVTLVETKNGYYTGFQGLVQTEPYGLERLAGAITPMVRNISIVDERVVPGGWKDQMRAHPPDMVGMRWNYTADVPAGRELAKKIREELGPEVPIIVGGHHISLRPQDAFIPEVTAVAIGEGEGIMQQAVLNWGTRRSLERVLNIYYQNNDGEFVSNVPSRKISPHFEYNSPEMNVLAQPRRDLVQPYRDQGGYYFLQYNNPYTVETARGCRFRCSFCSVWKYHNGEYKVESSDQTLRALSEIPQGAYTMFIDDLAFSDIKSTEKTADELIKLQLRQRYWAQIRADNVWPKDLAKRREHQQVFKKLAEAGLDMTLIGLESFDPAELKRVNKGSTVEQNVNAIKFLHDLGVRIWGAQIVFPHWGVEEYDKLRKTNQKLGIDSPQITILTPLPGSDDYDRALKNGTLTTQDPAKYDFFHWVVPTKLPPEETYRQIARIYRETGSLPTLSRTKDDLRSGRVTKNSLRSFEQRFRTMQDEEQHLAHLAQTIST